VEVHSRFGGTYCIIFRVEKEAKLVASWVGSAWKTWFDIGLGRCSRDNQQEQGEDNPTLTMEAVGAFEMLNL
jgi:hypothetical protein